MWTALLDLVTGAVCAGCAAPGRVLCAQCARGLEQPATLVRPSPCPPGLLPVAAAGEYAGLVRALIVGYKEHRQLSTEPVLAAGLARAVTELLASGSSPSSGASLPCRAPLGVPSRLVLIPVPSRRSTVRARGYDSTALLVRRAARMLGPQVSWASLLRVGRVADQAGLDAEARAANVTEAMWVHGTALGRLARRESARPVLAVICDDVATTGATAREAQRALAACGVPTLGIAVIAATRRRLP